MKRLYKIEQGKIISGVCGGVAEYFNIDPSLIRIGVVVASLLLGFGFGGIIAYIIAACILPKKSDVAS